MYMDDIQPHTTTAKPAATAAVATDAGLTTALSERATSRLMTCKRR